MPEVIATPMRHAATALLATLCLVGCGKAVDSRTDAIPTDQTSQSTTPPPPGDSTPKAADSQPAPVVEANDKSAGAGSQATVGTAASGAPPYTLNGAPEGNPAPKGGEPPKK